MLVITSLSSPHATIGGVEVGLDLRRLQRTSDGTYFVTLPKAWVVRNKLEKGAVLSFSERKDGKILAEPYGAQQRKMATVTLTPSPLLQREIEEKYLLGYDVFEVVSQQAIHVDTREAVRRIARSLVGLEIVEEDAKKIIVQCLIEPSLLFPDRILRRLHLITLGMQKDAISSFSRGDAKLANTVVERDEDVDRLYFLLVRVVRAALTDPAIADKLGTNPIDCLDYRILASLVEKFADHATSIAESTWPRPRGRPADGTLRSIERAGDALNRMHKEAVEAVFARNLALAQEVARLYDEARTNIKTAERGLVNARPETIDHLTTVISALKAMSETNVDIADLAATR